MAISKTHKRKRAGLASALKSYRVADERNSACTVKLSDLDWNNWWTDGMWRGSTYLHVRHKDIKDLGDTIHRVYCVHEGRDDVVRISMKDGELYWIVDKKK